MTVSVLASGQIGSDGTGTISGSHNPGVGVTPHFIAVFVVHNGSTTDEVTSATYGGVALHQFDTPTDTSGETGICASYYLDRSDSIPTGSQTVEVTVSGSSATRRVYCVSFSTDQVSLEFSSSGISEEDQANPSNTYAVPSNRYASGVACLFYGGAAASVSVATGAELAEGNFAGNSQCASLAWANTTVNNANLTIGWTAASDDVAAAFLYFAEYSSIGGNVTLNGSPIQNANITYQPLDGSQYNTTTDASGDWSGTTYKGVSVTIFCTYETGGNKYTAPLHWGVTA